MWLSLIGSNTCKKIIQYRLIIFFLKTQKKNNSSKLPELQRQKRFFASKTFLRIGRHKHTWLEVSPIHVEKRNFGKFRVLVLKKQWLKLVANFHPMSLRFDYKVWAGALTTANSEWKPKIWGPLDSNSQGFSKGQNNKARGNDSVDKLY